MKTHPRLVLAALALSLAASLAWTPGADARRARAAFGSVARGLTSAVQTVTRAATTATRAVTRVGHTATRAIASTATRVAARANAFGDWASRRIVRVTAALGRGIVAAATTTVRAVSSAASTVGNAVVSTARTVGGALSSAASAAWDKLKSFGFGFDKIKELFCETVGKPVCIVVDIVKEAKTFVARVGQHGFKGAIQMTLEDLKSAITGKLDRLKSKAEEMFAGFRSVLAAKEFNAATIVGFAKRNFVTILNLSREVFGSLLPFPFGDITSAALAAVGTAALTPALSGIAAVKYGMVKLLSFVLPKLILGSGAAFNFVNEHLPPGFKAFAEKLVAFATGSGGKGLLAGVFLVSSPETKKKLKAIALSIAAVSSSIEKTIDGTLKLARGDSFADAEKALSPPAAEPEKPTSAAKAPKTKRPAAKGAPKTRDPAAPPALTDKQLRKLIDGLAEMAQESLARAADEPVRKLMAKALQGMNRLLDAPRNALVAAVGSIPLVGGVVGAALNFGLGVIIDMVGEDLTETVVSMSKELIGDVVKDVKTALAKELLRTPGNMKSAQGAVALVALVGKAAGEVAKLATAASKGEGGLIAGIIVETLHNQLLKGIADPELRAVVAGGVEALAEDLGKRESLKGFTLTDGVSVVLKGIAGPLGQLVTRPVTDKRLRGVVAKATETLVSSLAKSGGVQKIMANPKGFLNGLALDLLRKLKPDLVAALTDKIPNETVKRAVATAVDEVLELVQEQGFGALLPFTKLLGVLGAAVARGFYDEFTSLLGSNVAKAKKALAAMADRITAVVAPAKALAAPVLASVDEGAAALVSEVRRCRGAITGLSLSVAQELFGCLGSALKSAGMAAMGSLYRQVERAINTDCQSAKSKVRAIAALLVKAHPKLKPTADRVVAKMDARCAPGGR